MHGGDLLRDILRIQHWTGKVETSLSTHPEVERNALLLAMVALALAFRPIFRVFSTSRSNLTLFHGCCTATSQSGRHGLRQYAKAMSRRSEKRSEVANPYF